MVAITALRVGRHTLVLRCHLLVPAGRLGPPRHYCLPHQDAENDTTVKAGFYYTAVPETLALQVRDYFVFVFIFCLCDTASCSPGWPWACYSDPPASASVLARVTGVQHQGQPTHSSSHWFTWLPETGSRHVVQAGLTLTVGLGWLQLLPQGLSVLRTMGLCGCTALITAKPSHSISPHRKGEQKKARGGG